MNCEIVHPKPPFTENKLVQPYCTNRKYFRLSKLSGITLKYLFIILKDRLIFWFLFWTGSSQDLVSWSVQAHILCSVHGGGLGLRGLKRFMLNYNMLKWEWVCKIQIFSFDTIGLKNLSNTPNDAEFFFLMANISSFCKKVKGPFMHNGTE